MGSPLDAIRALLYMPMEYRLEFRARVPTGVSLECNGIGGSMFCIFLSRVTYFSDRNVKFTEKGYLRCQTDEAFHIGICSDPCHDGGAQGNP